MPNPSSMVGVIHLSYTASRFRPGPGSAPLVPARAPRLSRVRWASTAGIEAQRATVCCLAAPNHGQALLPTRRGLLCIASQPSSILRAMKKQEAEPDYPQEREPKRGPGPQVEREWHEPIPDTPANIARALISWAARPRLKKIGNASRGIGTGKCPPDLTTGKSDGLWIEY